MADDDRPPFPLTVAERAAGIRWYRLGKSPWRKIGPEEPTAADFSAKHRARVQRLIKEIGRDEQS